MCQCRPGSIICLSQDWEWGGGVMLVGQISALHLPASHIAILLLLSVLPLCWEISAFSWVIHRCPGLPQSTQALQLVTVTEMRWARVDTKHMACTHTAVFSISHTRRNTPGNCLRNPGFSSSDDIDIIPPVMKGSLSAIPSSSSVFSLAPSRPLNHTSPISVRTFLLFPRQQWKKILPRRTQPMALAVVWVLVLSGSVELAACVCACFRSESMGGRCLMCRYCTPAFVPECICAGEHGEDCCVICLWVKGRRRVSMRGIACETRGCLAILKTLYSSLLFFFLIKEI